MAALPENLVLRVVSEIHDPVTTTDELIPSGETSSYRSNPLGLAEFTLSRKDPAYVGLAKDIQVMIEPSCLFILNGNSYGTKLLFPGYKKGAYLSMIQHKICKVIVKRPIKESVP